MGFKKLFCPNCGASVELDDSREFGFCTYCGTKIVQDKLIVEHRGNVSVSGVADTDAILDRATLFLEDGKFPDALRYCERALDLNPRNADAYVLKLMAQTNTKKQECLGDSEKPLDTFDTYAKALRFSEPEMKEKLNGYNVQSHKSFSDARDKKNEKIELLKAESEKMKAHLAQLKKKADRNHFWIGLRGLFIPLIIILSVALAILLSVTEKMQPHVAILLCSQLMILLLIGVSVMKNMAIKFRSNANKYQTTLQQKYMEIDDEIRAMHDWEEKMLRNV